MEEIQKAKGVEIKKEMPKRKSTKELSEQAANSCYRD